MEAGDVRAVFRVAAARRETVCRGTACPYNFAHAARREAVCRGASAGRPARWAGCPAVLGIEAPPSNSLRAVQALRSDNDGESVHEARCARGPQALRSSATLRRTATHHLPPRGTRAVIIPEPLGSALIHSLQALPQFCNREASSPGGRHIILSDHGPSRQRGPGGGDVGGGKKRGGRVGARSALPRLTRRRCLSEAAQGRGASSTARPGREHRSGVGPRADRSRRPCTQAPAVARRAPHMPFTTRA